MVPYNLIQMAKNNSKNPLWKVILTDFIGVLCLVLVPILGPLPGPGGIPLLLAGFGLLALNHDWADDAVSYIKKNSENMRKIIFPEKRWIQRLWDMFVFLMILAGSWINVYAESWLLSMLSIAPFTVAGTVFILNRNRITRLDRVLRNYGKR